MGFLNRVAESESKNQSKFRLQGRLTVCALNSGSDDPGISPFRVTVLYSWANYTLAVLYTYRKCKRVPVKCCSNKRGGGGGGVIKAGLAPLPERGAVVVFVASCFSKRNFQKVVAMA